MGTLQSVVDKVRIRIREKDVQFFTDADFISLANDKISDFQDTLRGYDCRFPLTEVSVDIEVDLTDGFYEITGKVFIEPSLIVDDNNERVPRYSLARPDDFSYEETATGIQFYNYSDVTGGITVAYWTAVTALTAMTDTLPFGGLFDKALQKALILECKMIRGHRFNAEAVLARAAEDAAVSVCLAKYGTIFRYMKGDLNV